MAAMRPERVQVVADGDVSYLLLVELVRDVQRAGVGDWLLRVDGIDRGQFTFSDEKPELIVNDLYFGEPSPSRMSTSQLLAAGPGTARRVELVLDFGATVADVAPALQAVHGLDVTLGFHTGPF